jgi:hypothetical protein
MAVQRALRTRYAHLAYAACLRDKPGNLHIPESTEIFLMDENFLCLD